MTVTNLQAQETGDHRFLFGLIAGGVIGAGLGMLFAPRAARELRGRLSGSAKNLGRAASERYEQVSARVGAVAQEYATRGQALRDGLADTVVRGAQKVEQYAKDAKTDQSREAPERSTT
jgi:gas vesicle protein